jgi:hypothetical protein
MVLYAFIQVQAIYNFIHKQKTKSMKNSILILITFCCYNAVGQVLITPGDVRLGTGSNNTNLKVNGVTTLGNEYSGFGDDNRAQLIVNGDVRLKSEMYLPSGTLNNLDIGRSSILYSNYSSILTGMIRSGNSGKIVYILTSNLGSVTIKHNSQDSDTGNRFRLSDQNDMEISNGGSAIFIQNDGFWYNLTPNQPSKEAKIINEIGTYGLQRSGRVNFRFNTGGTAILNSINTPQAGMIVYIYSTNSNSILVKHSDTTAPDGERIFSNTSADFTITGRGGFTAIYDEIDRGWRVIGVAN